MRIITLRAENVKRLKAVEITPDGDTVVIGGRNAQGKSSVLDSIWMALAGGSGSKETSRPIRDGETKASVMLDLGDLVVTRKWTPSGTTLEVAAPDGAKYGSPQSILDGLIGKLGFDPLAFAEQDSRKQLQTLLDIVELPFDPNELAERRAGIFDRRTDFNREVKRLTAQLDLLPPADPDAPDDEESAVELAEALRSAEHAVRVREDLTNQVTADMLAVERASEALTASKAALKAATAPDAEAVEAMRARLASVDELNAKVRAKQTRTQLEGELKVQTDASVESTRMLDQIDSIKEAAITNAAMPLDGLSFDDEGVLYNGVPFAQASSAERLRVGIAMAMALNPKIRVIRITDGSLLDSENLALISEMAGDNDFQIWIERVDETGKVGITIEDGEVVGGDDV